MKLSSIPIASLIKATTPFISLVLFTLAIFVLHHEIEIYQWHEIRQVLHDFPLHLLVLCTTITLLGYFALSFYDVLALEYAEEKLPYHKVLLTSFLSYTLSNNVGHSWLSGGSMRYRLYSEWGISGVSVVKVVVFCTISYFIGALTIMVGGYVFSADHGLITDKLPLVSVQATIIAGICLLIAWWGLVFLYRKPINVKSISLTVPVLSLALRQLLASLLELLLASMVLFLPLAHYTSMPFSDFLVIYIFAQLLGLVSQVPGGIGIFEGSFTFLASPHYPASSIIVSLIIYRAVYYFMPLLLAGVVMAVYELRLNRIVHSRLVKSTVNTIESVVPQIFSALLMLGAGVMLFSGATPALKDRLRWLEFVIPLPMTEFSHLLGSVVGLGLLLLSQAVRRRMDSAYFATIILLVLGILASLGKALDYEEASILGLMLISFIPARKHFYRKSALLKLELSAQWLVLAFIMVAGVTWLGFFSHRHVEYTHDLWWQFAWDSDASRFLRSLVTILVLSAAFVGYRLLTRTEFRLALPSSTEIEKAKAIAIQSSDTSAYLALTGDKYILWSENGNAFVMFDVADQYWVAMGDPVGQVEEYEELAWKFRTVADQHNAKIAFYQVSTQQLPLYLNLGLALIKLGEEAKVLLADFSLEGKKRASLRQHFNRLQRDGLTFEIVPITGVDVILPKLKLISMRWREDKKASEKGFSLGFFSEDYLRFCRIAIVRKEDEIIAFANLWELENKEELSIDLMRYEPVGPSGVMEYLIVSLMLWGKQQGYQKFNLGMAPLSGLERHPLAPLWNKVGNTIFRLGHEFYNFEGLHQYKCKFDPVWQPRYLAAPSGLSMATALLSVTLLISGNIKGIFSK